jgi:hypothetical protein
MLPDEPLEIVFADEVSSEEGAEAKPAPVAAPLLGTEVPAAPNGTPLPRASDIA